MYCTSESIWQHTHPDHGVGGMALPILDGLDKWDVSIGEVVILHIIIIPSWISRSFFSSSHVN